MKSIKAFIYIFYKSLTSPSYYKEIVEINLKLSIKYFIGISMLGALATTIITGVRIIPEMGGVRNQFLNQIKESYPEDLVLKIQNGSWEINKEEPYAIPMPKLEIPEGQGEEDIPENMVVFYKSGTFDDLEKLDTLALINEKNAIYKDGSGEHSYAIGQFPDIEMNKGQFLKSVDNFSKLLILLTAVFVLVIFVLATIFNLVTGVFYVLTVSAILWLLGSFLPNKIVYSSAVKIAAHTMTLSVLIRVILLALIPDQPANFLYPFLVNIIAGAFVLSYLNRLEKIEKS